VVVAGPEIELVVVVVVVWCMSLTTQLPEEILIPQQLVTAAA
tara:strand:- start:528 stop:653 length:126 start_codon:yes stop_codon:yes gene_type:complete